MLSSHNKKGSPKSGASLNEQEVQKGAVIELKEEEEEETKLVEC